MRAAATLAGRYLERRDRVGLVTFGGVLRWLEPGAGLIQRYRLIDALLETGVEFSYAWKGVNTIPARTLPPKALVIAVTPLLDERSIAALLDLRARGYDLVVVEVSPEDIVKPGDGLDALAYRLWLLRRAALRARFERSGVAVAQWRDDDSARRGARGGESISSSRATRKAVALGAASVGLAGGLTAWLSRSRRQTRLRPSPRSAESRSRVSWQRSRSVGPIRSWAPSRCSGPPMPRSSSSTTPRWTAAPRSSVRRCSRSASSATCRSRFAPPSPRRPERRRVASRSSP